VRERRQDLGVEAGLVEKARKSATWSKYRDLSMGIEIQRESGSNMELQVDSAD